MSTLTKFTKKRTLLDRCNLSNTDSSSSSTSNDITSDRKTTLNEVDLQQLVNRVKVGWVDQKENCKHDGSGGGDGLDSSSFPGEGTYKYDCWDCNAVVTYQCKKLKQTNPKINETELMERIVRFKEKRMKEMLEFEKKQKKKKEKTKKPKSKSITTTSTSKVEVKTKLNSKFLDDYECDPDQLEPNGFRPMDEYEQNRLKEGSYQCGWCEFKWNIHTDDRELLCVNYNLKRWRGGHCRRCCSIEPRLESCGLLYSTKTSTSSTQADSSASSSSHPQLSRSSTASS